MYNEEESQRFTPPRLSIIKVTHSSESARHWGVPRTCQFPDHDWLNSCIPILAIAGYRLHKVHWICIGGRGRRVVIFEFHVEYW